MQFVHLSFRYFDNHEAHSWFWGVAHEPKFFVIVNVNIPNMQGGVLFYYRERILRGVERQEPAARILEYKKINLSPVVHIFYERLRICSARRISFVFTRPSKLLFSNLSIMRSAETIFGSFFGIGGLILGGREGLMVAGSGAKNLSV